MPQTASQNSNVFLLLRHFTKRFHVSWFLSRHFPKLSHFLCSCRANFPKQSHVVWFLSHHFPKRSLVLWSEVQRLIHEAINDVDFLKTKMVGYLQDPTSHFKTLPVFFPRIKCRKPHPKFECIPPVAHFPMFMFFESCRAISPKQSLVLWFLSRHFPKRSHVLLRFLSQNILKSYLWCVRNFCVWNRTFPSLQMSVFLFTKFFSGFRLFPLHFQIQSESNIKSTSAISGILRYCRMQ